MLAAKKMGCSSDGSAPHRYPGQRQCGYDKQKKAQPIRVRLFQLVVMGRIELPTYGL